MEWSEELIHSILYFLVAVIVTVPLSRRIGLGEVPGYLAAGIVIGPHFLSLIDDPNWVLTVSEVGVILLLFSIGLEVDPQKLRRMRHHILYLGSTQLFVSALIILLGTWIWLRLGLHESLIIGFSLALSSTAFAIQLLVSRGLMASQTGRMGLSVLLLQDLAVVPILLLVQALGGMSQSHDNWIWLYGPLALAGLWLFGRYLLNPILAFVSRFGGRESMTIIALLIVAGAAFLMHLVHLSVGLGSFIAGMMLANSSFRHQLEAEIEPFKILTLGLFFVAIGMALDFDLLFEKPVFIVLMTLALVLTKALVIAALAWASKQLSLIRCLRLGLLLSQGGEFGFVVMKESVSVQLLSPTMADTVSLIVGLSMVMTAPLVLFFDLCCKRYKADEKVSGLADARNQPQVLILGFGRFGQITGRILAANGIAYTAIDSNVNYIKIAQKTGHPIYFGDVTRMDLLSSAGIADARVVVIGFSNVANSIKLVSMLRQRYPDLQIVARAYDRMHYTQLKEAGADVVIRELLDASLQAATEAFSMLGYSLSEALKAAEIFRQFDTQKLDAAVGKKYPADYWISINRELHEELKNLYADPRSLDETSNDPIHLNDNTQEK